MKQVSVVPILLLALLSPESLVNSVDPIDINAWFDSEDELIGKAVIPEGSCGIAPVPIKVELPRPKRLAASTFSRPGSLPWVVSLRVPRGMRTNWTICTGVLIRVSEKKEQSDIVVTSARCNDRDLEIIMKDWGQKAAAAVADENAAPDSATASPDSNANTLTVSRSKYLYDLYAVLGAHHQICPRCGRNPPSYAVKVDVEKVLYHPEFDKPEGSYVNDIAIMKLATPVNFTTFIQPICLPEPSATVPYLTDGILAGWGARWGPLESIFTGHSGLGSIALRYMSIPVQPPEECSRNKNFSSDVMLCVKYQPGVEEGPCGWDTGVPYFFKEEKGYTLEGIAGHDPSDFCGELSSDTYTRVASFVEWITTEAKRLTSVTDD